MGFAGRLQPPEEARRVLRMSYVLLFPSFWARRARSYKPSAGPCSILSKTLTSSYCYSRMGAVTCASTVMALM